MDEALMQMINVHTSKTMGMLHMMNNSKEMEIFSFIVLMTDIHQENKEV